MNIEIQAYTNKWKRAQVLWQEAETENQEASDFFFTNNMISIRAPRIPIPRLTLILTNKYVGVIS